MPLKDKQSRYSEKKLFYISPYLPNDARYKKHYSPAAQSKVEYLRAKLSRYGVKTVCVNCSLTVDNSLYLPKTIIDNKGACRLLLSKSSTKRMFLPFCGAIMLCSVFFFVLFNVKRQDTVILYHSIYYDNLVLFLKKIKRFKLIYEVEELYSDVRNHGVGRDAEIKKCRSVADAYIFPTEMLDEIINTDKREKVIVYGAYDPHASVLKEKGSDMREKVLVVYSGTLMQGKGATQAVTCAKALGEKFEIKIIGYGSNEEIQLLKNTISQNNSSCKVTFDGMKNGEEYIKYLTNCDIGLCIQPNNKFNSTSFPSILSYLNCGLNVVATDMEALRKSKLANYIYFSKDASPTEVSKAICRAAKDKSDTTSLLKQLDSEVTCEIDNLMKAFL